MFKYCLEAFFICLANFVLDFSIMRFQTYFLSLVKENLYSRYLKEYLILIDHYLIHNLSYYVETQEKIKLRTNCWSLPLTFTYLSLDMILQIFYLILNENLIIFISNKVTTLTHIIHTFEKLINPFTWVHPIIQIMPESL